MSVVPVLGLAMPLPAIIMLAILIYMLLLAVVVWIRFCFKVRPVDPALFCNTRANRRTRLSWQERCSWDCGPCCPCCPNFSMWDRCYQLAQSCDCNPPTLRSCLKDVGLPAVCSKWDCACMCQPPECESCNCLCFEIRIK
ncbi:uncharacterized protein LOC144208065 isoform X1 [Stigmatopora nigra]